jgi:Mrp family chromosome partitioning ATPase
MTAPTAEMNEMDASPLRSYLTVLRRRKFVAIQPIVIVPLVALLLTHFQVAKYQSSAEVLLNRTDIAAALTGIQDPTQAQAPERLAATQAQLARVPTIARRALKSVGLKEGPEYLLGESSVAAHPDADLLEFKVTDRSPTLARRLATAYARQFTLYQSELEQQQIGSALSDISRRLHVLAVAGQKGSPLYAGLEQRQNQLATLQALQTAGSAVVRDAGVGVKVAPRPLRNLVLGLAVGLILGIGLAFLYDTLDPRVWSAPEAAASLGLPLIGRIPRLKKGSSLVMAADPQSPGAEAFRMLSTNLDFVNEEKRASKQKQSSTILVTSAVAGEGKSTTAANLAIALARKGHHVVLVDLDLRGPSLDRIFSLNGQPGLTEVALGRIDLKQAIAVAGNPGNGTEAARVQAGNRPFPGGLLEIVPAGEVPLEPGEFVTRPAVESIIGELATRADFVLIDSAPMLSVGDSAVLSRYVDAVMVVVRLDVVRRGTLAELRRSLGALHCEKLGVVVTGTDEGSRYGTHYYGQRNRPAVEPEWRASERHLKRL